MGSDFHSRPVKLGYPPPSPLQPSLWFSAFASQMCYQMCLTPTMLPNVHRYPGDLFTEAHSEFTIVCFTLFSFSLSIAFSGSLHSSISPHKHWVQTENKIELHFYLPIKIPAPILLGGGIGDSPMERGLIEELAVRWSRLRSMVSQK